MNTSRRILLLAAILLCGPALAQSTVYVDAANCPGPGTGSQGDPFCTLADAITAAAVGDTVQVSPGTYNECINTAGKMLAILADDSDPALDAGDFIIDGGGTCTTVSLGGNSTLNGFTVRNGGDSGIRAFGSVSITNNIISGNTSPEYGGGLYIYADAGRGLYFAYGDVSVTVEDNLIDGNSTTADGGGVYLWGRSRVNAQSSILFRRNTVSGNSLLGPPADPNLASSHGGGISAWALSAPPGSSSVVISQNTISGNSAEYGTAYYAYGGGIFAQTYGYGADSIAITDNDIDGNSADGDGGGVSAWMLGDSAVAQPHALTLEGNTISNNSATDNAGGLDLFVSASDLRVTTNLTLAADRNILQANSSAFSGGGGALLLYLDDIDNDGDPNTTTRVTATLENNLIAQNSTDGFGGGLDLFIVALTDTEGAVELDSNTIADNTAVTGAGGVAISTGTSANAQGPETGATSFSIVNSIISENSGFGIGLFSDEAEGPLDLDGIEYNLVFGNTPDDYDTAVSNLADIANSTNITADPLLDAQWTPDVCSPAIDGADPAADFSAEPEPNGNRANLGWLGGGINATTILPDTNGDGAIDGLDILELATAFASSLGEPRYSPQADIDLNNAVEGADLSLIGARFGTVCP